MLSGGATPVFTRPFVLLCVTMFLGYGNHWVLTPVIPLYVDHLGGSAFIAGLALLSFSAPSFLFRPFIGRAADRWSVIGVLVAGLVLLSIGSLLFLVPLLVMVFAGGIMRGIGWAGFNTGGYTTLAIAAPAARRGEAAGYYTGATAATAIMFPALGLWLAGDGKGFHYVFLVSSVMALVSLPLALRLSGGETAVPAAAPAADGERRGLIDRAVLLATALNLCTMLTMPSLLAFMPLYARDLGVEHIGLFYVLAGVTAIIARPLFGHKSDAIGRGPAIALGLAVQFGGFLAIVLADALPLIVAGGVLVSLGSAVVSSTSTALAMDLSNPRFRGQSMATFSLSFQLGNGLGALISGALADLVSLRGMYVGSAIITLLGFILVAAAWKSLPHPAKK